MLFTYINLPTVFCPSTYSPDESLPFSFFFNDTATTEIYTLSLHDALPISQRLHLAGRRGAQPQHRGVQRHLRRSEEHRLNSSHQAISYAVFCLKKKKKRTEKKLINENVSNKGVVKKK